MAVKEANEDQHCTARSYCMTVSCTREKALVCFDSLGWGMGGRRVVYVNAALVVTALMTTEKQGDTSERARPQEKHTSVTRLARATAADGADSFKAARFPNSG